jgi:uncharacterized membrane protein
MPDILTKETHLRTVVKTVLYRILSLCGIFVLSLLWGASSQTAGLMVLLVIIFGSTIYYIHDRVWLMFKWKREDGKDSMSRSLAKTVIYRIITTIVGAILAKLVLQTSTESAVTWALAQAATNMVLYFIMERGFNYIKWGTYKVEK